ncbi:MAG TPA: hypothetical protein VNA18_00780 [Nitrososphaeraceae archaeon]|nr:hypothetical protein [Nitrososphaeraceae archaeon]
MSFSLALPKKFPMPPAIFLPTSSVPFMIFAPKSVAFFPNSEPVWFTAALAFPAAFEALGSSSERKRLTNKSMQTPMLWPQR